MRTIIMTLITVAALSATPARSDDSLQIFLRDGARSLQLNNYSNAKEAFEKALSADSLNLQAIKSLGLIYSHFGHHGSALEYLERAYEMDPSNADVCNNLGATFANLGRSLDAIEYYEKAVALDGGTAVSLTNLAREYSTVGQLGKALPALRQAWGLDSTKSIVAFQLGNAFAGSRDYDSAQVYYEKSLELGGDSPQLHYFLGTVRQRLEHMTAAVTCYENAVRLAPDNAEYLRALGMGYFALHRYEDASVQFKLALDSDSLAIPGWIGLGASYAMLERDSEADTILHRLFARDSAFGFEMLRVIGQEYERRKEGQ